MSSENEVVSSFEAYAYSITRQTRLLKCISNLHSGSSSSSAQQQQLVDKLFEIDAAVSRLEQGLLDLDAHVDGESRSLDLCAGLGVAAAEQAVTLDVLLQTVPTSMLAPTAAAAAAKRAPLAHTVDAAASALSSSSASSAPPSSAAAHSLSSALTEPITAPQLEAVSKATRGRLGLAFLSAAQSTLAQLLAAKARAMGQPRKKMTKPQVSVVWCGWWMGGCGCVRLFAAHVLAANNPL